jgi:hypothetical protein
VNIKHLIILKDKMIMKIILRLCNIDIFVKLNRIDEREFILLNLEVPLTCKTPLPEEQIGAAATLNMGFKQFL